MSNATKSTVIQRASPEERTIVRLLSCGHPVSEIADALDKNTRTLETQVAFIRKKYGCRNVPELVAYFLRNNIIS